MPVDVMVNGVPTPHYLYDEQVVLVRNPGPPPTLSLLPGQSFTCETVDGAPMVPRHPDTKDPLPLVTIEPGVLPSMLLPALKRVVTVNGGITFTRSSDDVPEMLAAVLAQVEGLTALQSAAETAASTAEAAQTAAEAAAADAQGTLQEAQESLRTASAGAVRAGVTGGAPMPVYWLFEDDPVPTGLPLPHLIIAVRRTASA